MNPDAETLRKLTAEIVESGRPLTSHGLEVMQLTLHLRTLVESHASFTAMKGVIAPSSGTEGGIAIDPWRASLSLEDQVRTAAFLRGGARAVEEILARHPDRPVHLIEAGCGPLAALSTPLMARFGPDQLQVTLIDLHRKSIDAAEYVVGKLGLSDRLNKVVCGDLTELELGGFTADVVVLETMYASLIREPQVALTRCLVRALPSALFLPERVTVDLQMLDPTVEANLMPPVPRDRTWLGRVFELDKPAALKVEAEDGYLPAGTIALPAAVEPGQRLFLTTKVEVFDDVVLSDYDSEITFPMELDIAPDSWPGRSLRFRYRISGYPGFEWDFVPGPESPA